MDNIENNKTDSTNKLYDRQVIDMLIQMGSIDHPIIVDMLKKNILAISESIKEVEFLINIDIQAILVFVEFDPKFLDISKKVDSILNSKLLSKFNKIKDLRIVKNVKRNLDDKCFQYDIFLHKAQIIENIENVVNQIAIDYQTRVVEDRDIFDKTLKLVKNTSLNNDEEN